MGRNHPYPVLVFFSVILYILVQIHGKKQTEALSNLFKVKFSGKSNIDKSHFKAIKHISIDEIRSYHRDGSKEEDRIVRLPGQPPVNFSQYGGYITVDKAAGRALYYYFVEAQYSPDESFPLLLWLNGGPGCSSLAYGAMQELGPFRVYSDGKTLYKNKYSWNYAANVLFVESPAGVGFSYSNRTTDYNKNGDKSTAEDNYIFLVNWLERFPEYKNRDFYISGESYAGHYVPQLAHIILRHNNKANKTIINLKGILIGNAVINDETDTIGMYDYLGTHALASPESIQKAKKICDFSPNATKPSAECSSVTDEISKDVDLIDIYNIYAPLCFSPNTTPTPIPASVENFDPCSDSYVYGYMNREEVQEAMHANVTKLKHDWEPCSDIIKTWVDSPFTVLPLLRNFLSHGLRVWIFSGDTDGRVPVTSTQYSIDKLKLKTTRKWNPWFLKMEVGGYTQVYEGNLTFVTVRGAGHQVPSYQPLRALSLVKHFLAGTPLPSTG